jgi:HK97 family phage portal protein
MTPRLDLTHSRFFLGRHVVILPFWLEGLMRWWPWGRKATEKRSITSVPWAPWDVGPGRYEVPSQDRALSLAPWFAAIRFLADGVSTLPLKAYRKVGDRREPLPNLPPLFQFQVDQGTLVDWLTRAITSMGSHGNALGLILNRDGFDFPTQVEWRPRNEFSVDDTATPLMPQWYYLGRRIDRTDIVHIPWLTVPGVTMGLSPIEYCALTIDSGLGAQTYGTDWFNAGGVPPGTFKNASETVDQEAAELIKARLTRAIQSRAPLVYGMEWDFNPIAIPPEQAQFVQTQTLTANQIAAIFGIHPEEVGGVPANSLTYNTEELRQTRRVSDWRPWLERLEAGLSALLPASVFVKFNADAVIRADLRSRFEVYKTARQIGVLSVDEIRALEDLPPLPDGSGADFTPLKAIETKPADPAAPDERDVGPWPRAVSE